ncbi:MAG: GNAT family N-acetyltransferase [Phycisphaerae bacterium]|nr:GNAT family N-acetyltransferase [Phycisphaerae bacterium]
MSTPTPESAEIRVRPIRSDDGSAMWDMFRRMSPDSRKYFWPHPFTRQVAEDWASHADDADQVIRVAADAVGKIYGYAWYKSAKEPLPLVGIGSADDGQGIGLGRRLMESLIAEARATGRQGLRLTTHKENRRAQSLYTRCGYRFSREDPSHHDYFMELRFAEESPAFRDRGIYAHGIPWHLTSLTADTWTIDDWKWYIRLLHAAGCNLLKLYIWPTQMVHPDDPETTHNAWRYDVYREALDWAHLWGMKTFVAFTNTAVPPRVWHARPDLRAEEILYRGVNLCWRRGKKTLLRYHRHLLETFAPVTDGILVWFLDPGFCKCSRCADYVSVVRDTTETYREFLNGRGDVHVSMWGFDWVEKRDDWFRAIPDFRRKVIETLPSGTYLLLPEETEQELIDLAHERGQTPLSMAFYQDPEAGLENNNVLPRPRLDQTEAFIRGQIAKGTTSLLGYRLTPFTQFPADWVMLRKMSTPDVGTNAALRELGTYLYGDDQDAERFADAIERIELWWQGGSTFTPQRDGLLAEAVETLDGLTWQYDKQTRALADATRVLLELSLFRSTGGGDVDALASRVQEMMMGMPIFQGFVQDQLWEHSRAKYFVRDRVQWWLETLLKA